MQELSSPSWAFGQAAKIRIGRRPTRVGRSLFEQQQLVAAGQVIGLELISVMEDCLVFDASLPVVS